MACFCGVFAVDGVKMRCDFASELLSNVTVIWKVVVCFGNNSFLVLIVKLCMFDC